MEIGNKRKELYSWNKLNYLNHTLKKYKVELYQSRNGSQRIQNELKEKIANTNRQPTELLNHKTARN